MHGAVIFLLLALIATISLGATICLVCLMVGLQRRHRTLALAGGFPLALGVAAVLFAALKYRTTPLEARAGDLVNLPPEARVVKVEEGDWAGDGSVYFRLPPSRTPEQWIDVVWLRNPPAGHCRGDGGSLELKCVVGGDSYSLGYEPETALYCYSVRLDD